MLQHLKVIIENILKWTFSKYKLCCMTSLYQGHSYLRRGELCLTFDLYCLRPAAFKRFECTRVSIANELQW